MNNINLLIIVTLILAIAAVFVSYRRKNDKLPSYLIIGALVLVIFQNIFKIPKNIEGFEDENEFIVETSPDYKSDEDNEDNDENYESVNNTRIENKSDEEIKNELNDLTSNIFDNPDKFENVTETAVTPTVAPTVSPTVAPTQRRLPNPADYSNYVSRPQSSGIGQQDTEGVSNIFNPQIIIKKGSDGNNGVYYKQTPDSQERRVNSNDSQRRSQWRDFQEPTHDLWDEECNQQRDEADANQRNSKDPWESMERNMRDSYLQEKRDRQQCGEYVKYGDQETPEELRNQAPENANKIYYPGYSFMPPSSWSMPQRRPPACIPNKRRLPSSVFDRGTPTNVLEFNRSGGMAMTENEVKLTNVGSILPKFRYDELYDEKYY